MTALLRYDAARQALAEAKTIDEVRDWEDKAAAVREYARRARNRDLEIDAAEIRVRAQRRRGELLAEMRAIGILRDGKSKQSSTDDRLGRITLAELDTTKNESSTAQKLAAMEENSFERLASRVRKRMEEESGLHAFDILKEDKQEKDKQAREGRTYSGGTIDDLHQAVAEGRQFSTILADPPWHFATRSDRGEGRSAGRHYVTDKGSEMFAMPVANLAAKDAVLFMWVVDWCLDLAFDLIKAWGFEHKTTAFTWAKQNASGEGWHMGQGYWTRANPEMCLLATRGHPKRLNADVRQLVVAPVIEHSRKPEIIHHYIERLVDGPYLELYARRPRDNWVTWGNETPFVLPPAADQESEAATSTAGIAILGRPETESSSAQASPEAGDAGEVQDRCASTSPLISGKDEIKALAVSPEELAARVAQIAAEKGVEPVEEIGPDDSGRAGFEPESAPEEINPAPRRLVESFDPETGEILRAGAVVDSRGHMVDDIPAFLRRPE